MSGIRWISGYNPQELDRAQVRFGLVFPPDLLDLLLDRQPVGGPDWNDENDVRSRLAHPFEGLLFDVEQNGLWWPEWGDRPPTKDGRAEVLRSVLAAAPRLIPVFLHRYLPAEPSERGNPVFSVHQSDVIHYGADLEDYIEREEDGWDCKPWPEAIKEIAFWSQLVRRSGDDDCYLGVP